MQKSFRHNPKYVGGSKHERALDEAIERAVRRDPALQSKSETVQMVLEIAGRLRELRERAGVSQVRLAKMASIPQSFIARLESPNFVKEPKLGTLVKIFGALGKEIQFKVVDVPAKR